VYFGGGAVTWDGVWIEGNYAQIGGMIMESLDTVIVRNSMILNNRYPLERLNTVRLLQTRLLRVVLF